MTLKLYYENPITNQPELCTVIHADYASEAVRIENHTDDLFHRAFGVVEQPSWQEYNMFLESRCFPRTRFRVKDLLEAYGIAQYGYEPIEIIKKTSGRMAEDRQYLEVFDD